MDQQWPMGCHLRRPSSSTESKCGVLLLEVPDIISKSANKRWQFARAAIYCYRVLHSLLKDAVAKRKENSISRARSYTILDIPPNQRNFPIDKTSLSELVKDKDPGPLRLLGGIEGVAYGLGTDIEKGIDGDNEDISRRHEAFGVNVYREPLGKGFFHFVVDAFKGLTMTILLACAALSVVLGIIEHKLKEGCYDGGSIAAAVFVVVIVSAAIKFRHKREFDKSTKFSNIQVDVLRSGLRQEISIFDIVVGDIVYLKIGDQVPADGLFLEGHSLQVDESGITGVSDHVGVNHSQNPFLICGSKVADGYARMLVTSVGMNTKWCEMMSSISRDCTEKTPLQARLNKLISSIGKVGLAVALLVLVVLLVRYFTGNTRDERGNREFNGSKTKVDDIVNAVVGIVTTAVTIVVVAIPEGLPLAVTLTLAYSMKKMMVDPAMVRKLSACDTMGSVTVICTDKTGTLTLNKMKVTMFWLDNLLIDKDTTSLVASPVLELIQQGVGLNTTGSVCRSTSGAEFEFSGSPTEKAILSWGVLELNTNMENLKQSCTILNVEAFNSERKRSGVSIRKKADNTTHVHWKGAPEMILAMCSSYYEITGNLKTLDEGERLRFKKFIEGMGDSRLRCIAFAHKQVSYEEYEDGRAHQKLKEDCLTFLGLAGLEDLCRPGVKKDVEDCQSAGVNIMMISGDSVFTARAIARECGILKPNQDIDSGAVVQGMEFRNYSTEQRKEKVDKICVMARSSPFDKLLMVQCLKQKGHVVAVTGDGTNDAPALKEADIGLAMGIQGTEVAKESADVVILDDSFASVAAFVRWGRCFQNSIRKLIQLQLTVNVAALVVNFIAAVSASEVPLTALHLLWVNLIVDTLVALALAADQPTKELMEKPAMGWTEPLITNIMWRNIIAQALFQIAVLLTLQFKGESIFGVIGKVKGTFLFNTSVLCQIFNGFNARKLKEKNVFEGIQRNKLFMCIIGVTIALQVAMVEFLTTFVDMERLDWGQWGACIGIAAVSWPFGWVVKCIPVPTKPFLSYLKW